MQSHPTLLVGLGDSPHPTWLLVGLGDSTHPTRYDHPCGRHIRPSSYPASDTLTAARSKSFAAISVCGFMPPSRATNRSGTTSSRVL